MNKLYIYICAVIIFLSNLTSVSAGPLDDNMIAYWQFNQDNGNVVDSSGSANEHEAVWHSGTSYDNAGDTTYNFENSLYLNGTSSNYLTVADHTDLDFQNGLSIIMWIKPLKEDSLTMLHKWRLTGNPYSDSAYTLIVNSTGNTEAQTNTPQQEDVKSSTGVDLNEWQQIATTFNPLTSEWILYKNGQIIYSESVSGTLNNSPVDLLIGYNPNNSEAGFYGWMDEIRLYDEALDPSMILLEYNITSGLIPEPLSLCLLIVSISGLIAKKRVLP